MRTLFLIAAMSAAHMSFSQVSDLDIVNSLLGKNAFAINKTLDSLKVWYYQHYDTQQGATGVRDLKKHYSIANSEGSVKLFSFSSNDKNIVKEITVNYRHDSKDQVEDLKKIKNFVDIHSKTPVLGMIERGGMVRAEVIKSASARHIQPLVLESVSKNAVLITDDFGSYAGLEVYYNRFVINHSKGTYVHGEIHTNSIEGFWSQFKRGLLGIYHWASEKHLQSYLDEFALRFNSRKISEYHRFNLVLANMVGRLTYKELIAE